MRRFLFAAFAVMMGCGCGHAQMSICATPGQDNAFLGVQTVRLWPGPAPQAKGNACQDTPTMTIFEPHHGTENGSAVIIFPGGAYRNLAGNLEGRQYADWFTSRGFRAFVVQYRLTSSGYVLPVPLIDAHRAIQLVRSRARDYFINPNRIVVMGSSAGGHLAALAATQFVEGKADASDPAERVSSRPDYLVLVYPWIGAISADTSHLSYCKIFDLMDKCEALRAAYSPDLFVTAKTPPAFWYHTFDDQTVPVQQGLRFYEAMVKAGVPAEAHIFPHGAHGSGLGKGDAALDQWPSLLETWLRSQGLLTKDPSIKTAGQ
jgi:acetyl esterase/lipase